MELRTYDARRDHIEASAILRELLRRGPVPYTIHPGEWEWWTQHGDHRFASAHLIGPGAVAEVGVDQRFVAAFGLSAWECVQLGERYMPGAAFSVGDVSVRDVVRCDALRALGFEPVGEPSPVFERATIGGVARSALADGYTIRPVRGTEGPGRAAAARRAFSSTMEPDEHTARYLRFMESHAYESERDLVVIAADGRIAAFAIFWPDTECSLAQFEPVGTDPDFQRRGLARALIAAALERLATMGIRRARVQTNGTNAGAIACYRACGFDVVDHIGWWHRPAA
jgi:ribosomal protein S18 acetylase RimI-like enzyme